MHRTIVRLALPVLASLLLSAGCSSPPRGDSGGRIDPYRTTAADMASTGAHIPSMLEFVDMTAEALARDIGTTPEIVNLPEKAVMAVGDVNNKSRTATDDYEAMLVRLRSKLNQSNHVRQYVRFIQDPRRTDREKERITGVPGQAVAPANRYAAELTYIIQGDFYEQVRGNRSQYAWFLQLVNLQTNEIIWERNFDLGYVRSRL
jgi:PBP1b-binding outer membrane lipoprotein LpoB